MELIQPQSKVGMMGRYLTGVRGIVIFAVLQSMLASLKIPLGFTPVPLTLQTLVLCMSIVVLRRDAFFAQILYLVLGCFGFPAFSSAGAGALYLFGPTGGYLVGFVVAAGICGLCADRFDISRIYVRLALFVTATAIVYVCGIVWLMQNYSLAYPQALTLGMYPFIPGDIIKILAAITITAPLLPLVKNT